MRGTATGIAGEFYCHSARRHTMIDNRYQKANKAGAGAYLNSRPSSSSGPGCFGALGIKSDDKCAPASNIKPEMNAQNINATEIEKACPYTSWKSSQGSALI